MLDLAQPEAVLPPRKPIVEIKIGELLSACDEKPTAPLVFFYGGDPVLPGYHVTEVKAGQFAALDCGGNPEAWTEVFIQLWDIIEGDRTHMVAGKFAAIIRKVADHVRLDPEARLTFEVSDGVAPMQLHQAHSPELLDGVLCVVLSPRAASCKPRDRWLEEQKRATGCCASSASKEPCCG